MKQYTENQYDDDLTLGNDEYDDSYYTDADDLFEFSTDDESPISRLKSLVLSIDWEITDEVLLQFNEELIDLKSIWAGETIYLVYVQALEKISKYIYQNKADSHPNAIKLLLTFYYNLEKIVSSLDLSEGQKKDILLEDVKKFENLKRQIKRKNSAEPDREPEAPLPPKIKEEAPVEDELLNLKAIVLGIDWEIGDQELNDLRREVSRLEGKYAGSRPKLILLQGIGTLAAYIKVKKSNSHPDAFQVMQLFYESLEKIVQKSMSFEEEKSILLPAVEKFNSFKALLGPTISSDPMEEDDDEAIEDYGSSNSASEMSPALADVSEDEAAGFQAEEEAMALGLEESGGVTSHIDDFFGENELNHMFAEETAKEPGAFKEASGKVDFSGNDSERDISLHLDSEETNTIERENATVKAKPALQKEELMLTQEVIGILDREKALQGVDVETEADDDSDELSLPRVGEELAPALGAMEEESLFSASTLDRAPSSSDVSEEIVGTIDGLFVGHDEIPVAPAFSNILEEKPVVGTNVDETNDEELIGFEDWLKEEDKEEELLLEVDNSSVGEDTDNEPTLTSPGGPKPVLEEHEVENQLAVKEVIEDQEEDNLNSFFTESDLGQSSEDDSEIDALFESLETENFEEIESDIPVETLEHDEAFFNSDKEKASSIEDEPAIVSPENRDEDSVEKSVSALFADNDFIEDQVVLDNEPGSTADGDAPKAVPVDAGDEVQFTEMQDADELEEDALNAFFTDSDLEQSSIKEDSDQSQKESSKDEVVFELFNEEIEPDITAGQGSNEEGAFPADGQWMADGESLILGSSETTESENVVGWAVDNVVSAEEQKKLDPLVDLQTCVQSLKIELNDTIFVGLFQEINILRQKWIDKPLEKTFLQLLLTITQHIDSYRYESSAEAYGLLVSVCEAMSNLKDGDVLNNQELLLGESLKVLEWQQGMLSRQAVKKGSQLTFAEPLRTEKVSDGHSDAQKDFDDQLGHYEDPTAKDTDFVQALTEDVGEREEQLSDGDSELMRESAADDLRKEIAVLRQTLQKEIAELRREFKKD